MYCNTCIYNHVIKYYVLKINSVQYYYLLFILIYSILFVSFLHNGNCAITRVGIACYTYIQCMTN